MKRPLLPPLIAMTVGIILAEHWSVSHFFLLSVLALLFIIAFLTLRRAKFLALIFVCLIFFVLGFTHMRLVVEPPRDRNHLLYHVDGQPKVCEGIITDVSQRQDTGSLLTVSVYRLQTGTTFVPTHGRVLLSLKTDQKFSYGDVVRFRAILRKPKNFKNPGVFDYARYLQYRGIWVRGTINRPIAICVLRNGYGSPILTPFMNYREKLARIIAEGAPFPASSIIQACVLGMQRNIPSEIMEKFNRTGTSHIIAISGFNMAVVAGLAAFMARGALSLYPPVLLTVNLQLASIVFAAIFVLFYTFIAGAGISVLRATITILVFMFALILGRVREAENTLALAAMAILLFSPHLLFDLSFQLSFSAVYALIYMTPRLMDFLPSLDNFSPLVKKTIRAGYAFVVATLSATLGTLPVILYHFHRFSPLVLVSNILVVPILGVLVVPLSMLIMITYPFSHTLTHLVVLITSKLVDLSIFIVDFLSSLPYSSLLLPSINYGQIALYLIMLILFISALGAKKYRFLKLGSSGLAAVMLFISFFLPAGNEKAKKLEITVLDVGQGQAIFCRQPDGKAALIDGGGSYDSAFDVGRNVITPFLLHRGITRLDHIIISHPHPDHIGGLLYVIKNFPVGEIWASKDTLESLSAKPLLEEARARGTALRPVSANFVQETESKTKWEVLHPPEHLPKSILKDENDRSLVLRLTYGETSFLFPGDITTRAEQMIIQGNRPLESHVLVVPHHGSRFSSSIDFIKKVSPIYACASGGSDNPKLPHPLVVQRFKEVGIPLYRTDQHGAVAFVTDGKKIFLQTFSVAYD